jgi:hypothetical protein
VTVCGQWREKEAKKLVKALKHWEIANNKTQHALAKLL